MNAKCIKFYEFGCPKKVLEIENKMIEPPKEHEAIVRMLARPINPSDLIPIRGSYSHRISLPNIPGYEGVGIIEDVGDSVPKSFIGKRVLPLRGEGTWQELVKTSAQYLVPVPHSIDDFTASQMYINPMTAWVICTEILNLKQNDILLVNACGSAIGYIFVQLSNILGFKLIAVTRNNKYTEDLIRLGASYVIDTSNTPLFETVKKLTNGRGADAAIDSVGGVSGTELAFSVQPNGFFLTIGLLSGKQVDWKEITDKTKVKANLFHLRHWNNSISIAKWQDTFQHLITLIVERKLQLMKVDTSFDLMDIKKAIDVVESSKGNKGKIFITSY